MATAARHEPRGRHHPLNTAHFLARLKRVGIVDTSYAVDPDFDDDPNSEPLPSEGLDHLHNTGR